MPVHPIGAADLPDVSAAENTCLSTILNRAGFRTPGRARAGVEGVEVGVAGSAANGTATGARSAGSPQEARQIFSMLVPPGAPMGSPQVIA